ncbi:hypothetical protein [Sphingorhabdus sp. EL138]|uniref:hypothetical protein n=1 Tax=Sphingorhabdus sp. EL138 TaxID=2073156 RepID=UPI000D68D319|nr:hypothetical protein [Sphingorhabdus sp. EL138]
MKIGIQVASTVLAFFLAGCGIAIDAKAEGKKITCAPTTVSAYCILQTAEKSLTEIEDGSAWATSAAELAVAYDSNSNPEKSIALLTRSLEKISTLPKGTARDSALGDVAISIYSIRRNGKALMLLENVRSLSSSVTNEDKRADINGKRIVGVGTHGEIVIAIELAKAMPEQTGSQAGNKAITFRKLSARLAKSGEFDAAYSVAQDLTMSIAYYRSMVRSDIAVMADKKGDKTVFEKMLAEAAQMAREQDNGYFIAAALRDIGQAYVRAGHVDKADQYFKEARESARKARSFHERARSMSRIATRLGDVGRERTSLSIINESISLARQEENEAMRHYSLYEIAGAAAMSGNFEISRQLIDDIPNTPFGSATSLKSATQRDLAWGLFRYGRHENALATALAIRSIRERVHTLSRLVRIMNNPKMEALPRYL